MFRSDLLAGKRVLITGGGSGLGKIMGRRLLELGGALVICGRRQEVLEATAAEFAADFPERVAWQACDIREPDQIEAMLERTWQDGPLDGLVNNAAGNFVARTETLSPRAVDAVLNIVLRGTAFVTLACAQRWLAEGRSASVLSILTTYAWTGSAFVVPSAMAKAGILAMTRSLAVEWGPRGLRFNGIAPGPFPTEGAWRRLVPDEATEERWKARIPLRRFGIHQELADLAAYLLADGSAFINGEVVTIDGGEWLHGAGEFNHLEELSEAQWAEMRAR